MNDAYSPLPDTGKIYTQIQKMIEMGMAEEDRHADTLTRIHPNYQGSARNLLHYLSLRRLDLRELQEQLSSYGISSIAHSEGYTLANLLNIRNLLALLHSAVDSEPVFSVAPPFDVYTSKVQLKKNAAEIFGTNSLPGAATYTMVTMPAESAEDYSLVLGLVASGMDLARINTSHDDPQVWEAMIRNIRRAEEDTGFSCRVYMDLSGPKLRTVLPPHHGKKTEHRKKNGNFVVFVDDELTLLSQYSEGFWHPAEEPTIGLSLPEVFEDLREGQRIFFDDGKIGGIITDTRNQRVKVKIHQAARDGTTLRGGKGVNLPDTTLALQSLTQADRRHLPFVARHADVVGYSFVRYPHDLEDLQEELSRLDRSDMGIVLKIETKEAFNNLPQLLLTAMRSPRIGVMIARGDLAVEVGFQRIAEVQEEILWLCEAAHVPNIWATQVLERLAKKGLATRSEITDAAMASRAECVMLNKGPYITQALRTLQDILHRMADHQDKRRGSLRPLSVARNFLDAKPFPSASFSNT